MQGADRDEDERSQELDEARAGLEKDEAAEGDPVKPADVARGHWYRSHSGPLPDQDWFASLEAIHPGSTEIILRDFTEERRHQRRMQERASTLDAQAFSEFSSYQKTRLWIAGFLALFLAASGLALILLDKAVYGFVLLVGEIAGLAGVFLVSKVLNEDGGLAEDELKELMAAVDEESSDRDT